MENENNFSSYENTFGLDPFADFTGLPEAAGFFR